MSLSAREEFKAADKAGLSFLAFGGSISFCSVTGILLYTAIKRSRLSQHHGADVSDSNLFLTLMVADFIRSIGIMLNIIWVVKGRVVEGPPCTAQGVLIQMGSTGVSLAYPRSLAITIHIFFTLVFHWKPGKSTSTWIVVAIWFCVALLVTAPNLVYRGKAYYGDTGFWCFINSQYNAERVVTSYLWAWLAGLTMLILYPIMAARMCCWARGSINQSLHATVARKLILFPIVYILGVLPNSVTRWLAFTNHDVPDGITLAAYAIHTFSGFVNLILFSMTRPTMVFGKRQSLSRVRHVSRTYLTADVPRSLSSIRFEAPDSADTHAVELDATELHCNCNDEKNKALDDSDT